MRLASVGPFLLLGLLLRKDSGSSTPARALPTGVPAPPGPGLMEVARTLTGGQPVEQWFRDRYRVALEVLALNLPPNVVPDAAISVVAQWAHETGRGKSEFNFNMGGWRARKNDVYFTARDVQTGRELFRWTAYSDLPNAVQDQLRRLHDTFPTAWALLAAEPNSSRWVEELGRKHYYVAPPGTSQEQHIRNYTRAWASNRAELARLAIT